MHDVDQVPMNPGNTYAYPNGLPVHGVSSTNEGEPPPAEITTQTHCEPPYIAWADMIDA